MAPGRNPCSRYAGADLLISECYSYRRVIPGHLDYATLMANRQRLGATRIILTHMGPEMLANLSDVQARGEAEAAEDGRNFEV